jgi:hypothetical protein
MKKALINPIDLIDGYPSVVSVNETEFPCVPAYYWLDCPDDTQSGMYYKDGQFYIYTPTPTPPEPPIPPTKEENKQIALTKLKNTDWVEMPSVSDPSLSPHLLNKSEFILYRSDVRAIAVNPIEGFIQWPLKPTESWSNN